MRHNFLAQFLLIAALALGSNSAFAEAGSDSELSSQIIVEAEESISEELKSIYQEEVAQVLAEGISYSEEERLSDFPDLDSLLADEVVPTRVAKISKDQKVEKRNRSDSKFGIQNRTSASEIFSRSSVFSQNCLLGLNAVLLNLKIGQGAQLEFLPGSEPKEKSGTHETSSVAGVTYREALSGCSDVISVYLSGKDSHRGSFCFVEKQRNLSLGSGVPTTGADDLGKDVESTLGAGWKQGSGRIGGMVWASGKFVKNRVFSWVDLGKEPELGKAVPDDSGLRVATGKSSVNKVGTPVADQELQPSLEKVSVKAGQGSHKFSSGRPTPEILT